MQYYLHLNFIYFYWFTSDQRTPAAFVSGKVIQPNNCLPKFRNGKTMCRLHWDGCITFLLICLDKIVIHFCLWRQSLFVMDSIFLLIQQYAKLSTPASPNVFWFFFLLFRCISYPFGKSLPSVLTLTLYLLWYIAWSICIICLHDTKWKLMRENNLSDIMGGFCSRTKWTGSFWSVSPWYNA